MGTEPVLHMLVKIEPKRDGHGEIGHTRCGLQLDSMNPPWHRRSDSNTWLEDKVTCPDCQLHGLDCGCIYHTRLSQTDPFQVHLERIPERICAAHRSNPQENPNA